MAAIFAIPLAAKIESSKSTRRREKNASNGFW